MYGLALMAAGQVLNGYGDAQSASATNGALGEARRQQLGLNQQYSDDLNRTIPRMGAPALRGDIDQASAPLLATQQQNRTLGDVLGRDLGASTGGGATVENAVAGGTNDAIRQAGYGISAFGLRRGQEMQGRTLGDLMSRRERLATRAEGQANLLPAYLRAAALQGSELSDAGQLVSTAGSMYTGSGHDSSTYRKPTPKTWA